MSTCGRPPFSAGALAGGKSNNLDWYPDKTDHNVGYGQMGTCCAELDIWEANVYDTQMTVHACNMSGWLQCSGTQCGDKGPHGQPVPYQPVPPERYEGVCDKNGCDLNPYRTVRRAQRPSLPPDPLAHLHG